jgi:hypothetical protein
MISHNQTHSKTKKIKPNDRKNACILT